MEIWNFSQNIAQAKAPTLDFTKKGSAGPLQTELSRLNPFLVWEHFLEGFHFRNYLR